MFKTNNFQKVLQAKLATFLRSRLASKVILNFFWVFIVLRENLHFRDAISLS